MILNTKELVTKYRSIFNTNYCNDANCVGAWLFTEGSGTTVADASGEGHTGTFASSGNPPWDTTDVPFAISGSAPNSVDFDGTSGDYISTYQYSFAGSFSIGCWINTVNTSLKIAMGEYGGSGDNYWLGNNAGTATFSVNGASATKTGTIHDGNWHHLYGVKDGTTGLCYLDGVAGGGTTFNTSCSPTYTMVIGQFGSASGYGWDGLITEAAVFSDALSSTEINEIYDYGLAGSVTTTQRMLMGMGV